MNIDRNELGKLFADWSTVEAIRCDAAFTRPDAVIAFVFSENPAEAYGRWADAQAELSTFRQMEDHHLKDFFLVLVIESLTGAGVQEVERLLDNPYVCRKLLIELRGREMRDVVGELLPMTPIRDIGGGGLSASFSFDVRGLSPAIVERLATDGVEKNVAALLEEVAAAKRLKENS